MDNVLIIYDMTGRVIFQAKGTVQEPVGIPFMWIEIPEGKYIQSVNTSGQEHIPIFADLTKSEIQLLQEQIDQLTITLGDALLNGGV